MKKEEIEQLQEVVKKVVSAQMQNCGEQSPSELKINQMKPSNKVAIGADHGGFGMKVGLIPYLEELGYQVIDCGTYNTDSVDYPDFAHAVAKEVSTGNAWRGIMIDGAGIGSCMTANKVKGVRAAMCYDYSTAVNSREHNAANLLTMGSGLIGMSQAKLIVKTWLSTEFGGGRHQNRIDKINQVEQQYFKDGN